MLADQLPCTSYISLDLLETSFQNTATSLKLDFPTGIVYCTSATLQANGYHIHYVIVLWKFYNGLSQKINLISYSKPKV